MANKAVSKRSGNKPAANKSKKESITPEKNKSRKISQGDAVKKHYHDIAFRLKMTKMALLIFLVGFILIGIITNPSELSIDSLSHLLRYIDIQNSEKTQLFEFNIDMEDEARIEYYRDNIVVLKRNKLDIYDLNGKRIFSHTLTYSMPVLEISDKYVLAFDSGSNKMQIFNSFSRLYEYKNEYNEVNPIYGAKITDKGNIVYISSEKGYKSVVTVMNSGFKEIYRCGFGDKYVFDADIDEDAKRLAVAAFSGSNGDFLGEILLYDTETDENYEKRIVTEGEIPLIVEFNKAGFFSIFENSLKIFDADYEKLEDYNFSHKRLEHFCFTSELAAAVLSEKTLGNEKNILIFNYSGELIYSQIINTDIINIKFSQDSGVLYFLTRKGIYRIDMQEKNFELLTAEYDDTSHKIIYADDENIFVSGHAKINIINIANIED